MTTTNDFLPVADRLGAVDGLDSDHVPVAFKVAVQLADATSAEVRVISLNISNESAHHWFSTDAKNAYGRTSLVATPEQLKGKMERQLEELANLLNQGVYHVALIQEADSFSVKSINARSEQLGVKIFSCLADPDSPFHGQNWALQCIMVASTGDFVPQGCAYLSGDFVDSSKGRKSRTELPLLDLAERRNTDVCVLQLGCAHIRGNDAQDPVDGLLHAFSMLNGQVPVVVAGDFNTAPCNISRQLTPRGWTVAIPPRFTHMCKFDSTVKGGEPRYCLAAYDNVVSRGCTVTMMEDLPPIPAAARLSAALEAMIVKE
jgi:hypothetical protein